jgi:hypothetical protein
MLVFFGIADHGRRLALDGVENSETPSVGVVISKPCAQPPKKLFALPYTLVALPTIALR